MGKFFIYGNENIQEILLSMKTKVWNSDQNSVFLCIRK